MGRRLLSHQQPRPQKPEATRQMVDSGRLDDWITRIDWVRKNTHRWYDKDVMRKMNDELASLAAEMLTVREIAPVVDDYDRLILESI